jgi:hypothetical protein
MPTVATREPMLMIDAPGPRSASAPCVTRYAAVRFVSSTRRHSAGASVPNGSWLITPALLTTTSSVP